MMLTLENGAGVLGDVSYFMPDGAGYRLPQYWRTTFWGRHGLIETATGSETICLVREDDREPRPLPPAESEPGGYFRAFREEIAGAPAAVGQLDTAGVIASARLALRIQAAADAGAAGVDLLG